MFSKLTMLLFLSTAFIPGLCSADDSSANLSGAKTLTSSPINSGALLETLIGLLLVLGCIAFLAWLLRRTGQFNTCAQGEMKIIAGLSLGPRERAVLIQVGKTQILVGVTAQHVQTLHILEQPILTDKAIKTTPGFADRLQQIIRQRDRS